MGECYSGTTCIICRNAPIDFIGVEIIEGVLYRKYECTGCKKHFRSKTSLMINNKSKLNKTDIAQDLYEMAIDNQSNIYNR